MKVAYVYIGILANSSRALKQLEELNESGVNIDVFVGNENNQIQDYSSFKFKVREFPIIHGGMFKIKSLINPLLFCYECSKNISENSYDFIICQELTTFPTAFFVNKKSKKNKVIFDNNELSVERYTGLKKIIWGFIQKRVLPKADIIIHAEINRLNYFVRKHNLNKGSQKLVCNYPVKIKNIEKKISKKIRVIYLGVIHPNRQVEDLVNAFKNLKLNIILDIVGPGDEKYINKIKTKIKKHKNINVLPSIKQDHINDFLKNYDIGIAFYSNSNLNNYYCAPNKIFQYIANRLAIITNNYPGLINVVEDNNIGVCVDDVNSESICSAINKIIENNLSTNISKKIINKFSWESQKEEFLSIFKNYE